jgi:hypothetical protein
LLIAVPMKLMKITPTIAAAMIVTITSMSVKPLWSNLMVEGGII